MKTKSIFQDLSSRLGGTEQHVKTEMLHKNKKLFEAHRMYGMKKEPTMQKSENGDNSKMYVNPGFKHLDHESSSQHEENRQLAQDVSIVMGDLPPLQASNQPVARNAYNDHDTSTTTTTSNISKRSSRRPNGLMKGDSTSSSGREASDPMSLDSGVITTLSRSISPMSSSNPGSRGCSDDHVEEIEEETNVDGSDNGLDDEDDEPVVNVADTSSEDTDSSCSADGKFFDSLKPENVRIKNRNNNNRYVTNNKRPAPQPGRPDPLAKLYDNAVLKIPKVIPSDSESLYSECNSFKNGKLLNSLDSKKHRLLNGGSNKKRRNKPVLSETENPYDMDDNDHDNSYESIKCSAEAIDTAGESDGGLCDVYVNRYMTNTLTTNSKSIPEVDEEAEENNDIAEYSPTKQQISSMDKMIVTIGSNDPNDANVYSGRLLIEVAGDDYSKKGQKVKQFDADTLERGLVSDFPDDSLERPRKSRTRVKGQYPLRTSSTLPVRPLIRKTIRSGCLRTANFCRWTRV